jgi:hypothetical protein
MKTAAAEEEKAEEEKAEEEICCTTCHSTPSCMHNTNRSSRISLWLLEVYNSAESTMPMSTPRAAYC